MKEKETLIENDSPQVDDLPVLKLSKINDNFLREVYHHAKYLSIIAGNKSKHPEGNCFKQLKDYTFNLRSTRQKYEIIAPKLKTIVIGLENLRLLKNGVPSGFKIGIVELDSEPFKVDEIDKALYFLNLKGEIRGIADFYLNYAIAFAISNSYSQKRLMMEDLLDLSTRYQKRDGDKRESFFSLRHKDDNEYEWIARTAEFPFYLSTKIAVWLP